jgi:probable phosphoglycerate mutase
MIYIARHGQTAWNAVKKLMGQTDIPLNEVGKAQARDLAKKVSKLNIKYIFSSDLLRAKETADIINETVGLYVTLDSRLRELNYGDIEGAVPKEVPSETWERFNEAPEEFKAEAFSSLYDRIKSFFGDLALRGLDNVLVVAHGGALRMTMYYAKNKEIFIKEDYDNSFKNTKIDHISLFELEI